MRWHDKRSVVVRAIEERLPWEVVNRKVVMIGVVYILS